MTERELIESASTKKVLFCGERIIDRYNYVSPLGRPTKDAILSVELKDSEVFEGGVTASANHALDFAKRVDYHIGGHIVEKERYVEPSHHHKLFQVYKYLGQAEERVPNFESYDVVIVCDYGHGMAHEHFLEGLSVQRTKYLAINVQTNSGNYGFNLATKYNYADYLCVDESEARLATQNKDGPIEESLFKLAEIGRKTVITLGKSGAIGWCRKEARNNEGPTRVPAFTDKVVDTMGAGDAFFAITALVAQEADMKSLLRIGNAAAAIKAQIVGHRGSVTKKQIMEYLV